MSSIHNSWKRDTHTQSDYKYIQYTLRTHRPIIECGLYTYCTSIQYTRVL